MGAPRQSSRHHVMMGSNSWDDSSAIKSNKKQPAEKKAHKRKRLSRKYIQTAVNDPKMEAFNPKKHCRICVAKKNGEIVKGSHDIRCPKNRKTRGQSEATVKCEKDTRRLAKLFGAPMSDPEKERQLAGTGTPSIATAFPAMRKVHGAEDGMNLNAMEPGLGTTAMDGGVFLLPAFIVYYVFYPK